MKKLNNILNREDYLNAVNEGKIGDFLKRGVQKIKDMFFICARKVKNIITVFDSNGNILPVTTPQSIAEYFHNNKNITVVGTKTMNKEIKELGGTGCNTVIKPKTEDSYKDDSPDGVEYFKWIESGYQDSNVKKNLLTLQKILESRNIPIENKLNEESLKKDDSVNYSGKETEGVRNYAVLTTEEFEENLTKRIEYYCKDGENNNEKWPEGLGNMLILGAPGIGKSTIPEHLVMAFNKEKSEADRIALISVNCANINPGDLLMPRMPRKKEIYDYVTKNYDALKDVEFIKDLSKEKLKLLATEISKSAQFEASSAPQPWLPCYRITENKSLNRILDSTANGNKMFTGEDVETEDMFSGKKYLEPAVERTGSGGIILFDEFLRCEPSIFNELMTFLLDRRLGGWQLGSKWFIVACANRPCDDKKSALGWDEIKAAPAQDRWCQIFHLDPNPESWKKWARKKGFDEILLDFMFDEDNKKGDEFFNWYRAEDPSKGDSEGHKPVTPRNWVRAQGAIINYMIDNKDKFKDDYSISKMSINEVQKVLKGYFDDTFLTELINWLKQNCKGLKISEVIEKPLKTPMPVGEHLNEVKIMKSLFKQMVNRYTKGKISPTDEELTNIMIWIGRNFKKNINVVASEFMYKLHYGLKKVGIWDFHKFGLMFMAAFPEKDYMEVIEYPGLKECLCNKSNSDGKTNFFLNEDDDILEVVKGFAKEYFPWRLKENGDLLTVYEESVEYDAEKMKKETEDDLKNEFDELENETKNRLKKETKEETKEE